MYDCVLTEMLHGKNIFSKKISQTLMSETKNKRGSLCFLFLLFNCKIYSMKKFAFAFCFLLFTFFEPHAVAHAVKFIL